MAIMRGDQYLTIFKPIKQEAESTAKLAAALAKGDKAAAAAIATGTLHDPVGNRDIKSVLLEPQLITKDQVKTVVTQGYVKASDICGGTLAATCSQLGIS
jgi:D-xylose transport system substrate-binding protein